MNPLYNIVGTHSITLLNERSLSHYSINSLYHFHKRTHHIIFYQPLASHCVNPLSHTVNKPTLSRSLTEPTRVTFLNEPILLHYFITHINPTVLLPLKAARENGTGFN